MKYVNIRIETTGAAFSESPVELSRILRELSDAIAAGHIPERLRDVNGNTVGTVDTDDVPGAERKKD